jgi:hypothetical protein
MSEKFGLRCLNETAEAKSTVPRDHVSGFRSFNETAEADLVVSVRLWNTLLHRGSLRVNDYWCSFPLKGNLSKNKYIGKHYIYIVNIMRVL